MNLKYYDNIEKAKKEKFISEFGGYINKDINKYSEVVFLCIGTDKLIGDSFGPLVGSKLKEKLQKFNIANFNVYGTLEENVCYTNIKDFIKKIEKVHPKSYLIIIDAALSEKKNIGNIYVDNTKLKIAKCLNKSKIEIGNLSIKAVVGKNYKLPNYNFFSLQNISLNQIMKLSNIVADGILEVIKYI